MLPSDPEPSANTMVPDGVGTPEAAETAALNVRYWPGTEGFAEVVSANEVAAAVTVSVRELSLAARNLPAAAKA